MIDANFLFHILRKEILSTTFNINIIQTLIYFLSSLFLAYLSFQIFKILGERYTTPKPHTRKIMKFLIYSIFYFFSASLFELLTIYFSLFSYHPQRILFNFLIILVPLTIFYTLTRYHLCLSIYYKFKHKNNQKTPKKTTIIKTTIFSAIALDFAIFFSLWLNYDIYVIYYNIIIFFLIFFWIIRHNDPKKTKVYTIYFLLLFLVFNRMNFMFIDFSYSKIYYIFDLLVLTIIIGTYITIYYLIKNNKNLLEK